MNNDNFHKPFIQSLIIVAVVTVFAMFSSRLIVNSYYPLPQDNSSFTSAPPELSTK